MTVNELDDKLQELKKAGHGDLPVVYVNSYEIRLVSLEQDALYTPNDIDDISNSGMAEGSVIYLE